MNHPTTKTFCRFLLGAVMAFGLQLAMSSAASASCGDYLLHRSVERSSAAGHTVLSVSPNADEARGPGSKVPSAPCRGINCSRGAPLAPVTPLRVQGQRHDQWCVMTMTMIANGSLATGELSSLKTECQPIHRSFRLDRPPQVG